MTAWLVQGLGFGDEGKGTTVDALCRETGAKLVVRFNGGPQAAHHVVTSDLRAHCFSQFGSGYFAGARTHLSRFMLVDPLALAREAEALATRRLNIGGESPLARLTVDPRAIVVTPYHQAVNRLTELWRDRFRHGSCGRGIGEARQDAIHGLKLTMEDVATSHGQTQLRRIRDHAIYKVEQLGIIPAFIKRELDAIAAMQALEEPYDACQFRLMSAWRHIATIRDADVLGPWLTSTRDVVFEGAQGVLLDEEHGFQPHTTWTDCTFGNADTLMTEVYHHARVVRIGVMRAYATRHGEGPFPTESAALTRILRESHNRSDPWMGSMRKGWFDAVLARYAKHVIGGVDFLALTCLDQMAGQAAWLVGEGVPLLAEIQNYAPVYRIYEGEEDFLRHLDEHVGIPVGMMSRGFMAQNKTWSDEMRNLFTPSRASAPNTQSEPASESVPKKLSEPSSPSVPEAQSEPDTASVPEEDSAPINLSAPQEQSEPQLQSAPKSKSEPGRLSVPSYGSEPSSLSAPQGVSEPKSLSAPKYPSGEGQESMRAMMFSHDGAEYAVAFHREVLPYLTEPHPDAMITAPRRPATTARLLIRLVTIDNEPTETAPKWQEVMHATVRPNHLDDYSVERGRLLALRRLTPFVLEPLRPAMWKAFMERPRPTRTDRLILHLDEAFSNYLIEEVKQHGGIPHHTEAQNVLRDAIADLLEESGVKRVGRHEAQGQR